MFPCYFFKIPLAVVPIPVWMLVHVIKVLVLAMFVCVQTPTWENIVKHNLVGVCFITFHFLSLFFFFFCIKYYFLVKLWIEVLKFGKCDAIKLNKVMWWLMYWSCEVLSENLYRHLFHAQQWLFFQNTTFSPVLGSNLPHFCTLVLSASSANVKFLDFMKFCSCFAFLYIYLNMYNFRIFLNYSGYFSEI